MSNVIYGRFDKKPSEIKLFADMEKSELLCEMLEYHQMIEDNNLGVLVCYQGIELLDELESRGVTTALNENIISYRNKMQAFIDARFMDGVS